MKRLSLAMMFGAATAYFAVALGSAPAFLFCAVAIVSCVWRGRLSAPLAHTAQRLLYAVLALALGYSWFLRLYPVMSLDGMHAWSLSLGYALAALGGLFLLFDSDRSEAATSLLSSAGVFVVSAVSLEPAMQPYLAVAGVAAFGYLASDTLVLRRASLGLTAVAALVASSVAALIVIFLPWTQGKVEQSITELYSSSEGEQEKGQTRLGELQALKLSKAVVMRVWSLKPHKLRSRVLVRFDGTAWHRDPSPLRDVRPSGTPDLDNDARAFLQQVPGADFVTAGATGAFRGLARTQVTYVGGGDLATPGGSFLVRAPAASLRMDRAGVLMPRPQTAIRIYGVLHDPDDRQAQKGPAPPTEIALNLALPKNLDPRIVDLGSTLVEGAGSSAAMADRIVSHMQTNYRYSLDVGDVDRRNPLGDFLFNRKQGWCEYFATAAAVLLRTQGVPARYVEGFNVPGSQRKGDYFLVREHDRHAWIEVYIEGAGWIDYDPTPADEYASLRAGLNDGVAEDVLEWVRMRVARFYIAARHLDWSSLRTLALRVAGLGIAVFVVIFVVRRWPAWRTRPAAARARPPSEVERLVMQLDTTLERLGCGRPRSRAPLEHWSSLPEAQVPSDLREVGLRIIRSYYRERFGDEALSTNEVEALGRDLAKLGARSAS